MDINFTLLRQISILSAFFGAIAGILTLIPYVGTVSFIFLICFIAPIVIWILVKYNCLSLSSIKDGIITGAISGVVSYLAFSAIFIPVSVILVKFFGLASNYGVGLMLNNAGFFILTVVSVFMSVVSATVNAFTGFITFYVIELVNSIEKK